MDCFYEAEVATMLGRILWVQRGVVLCASWFPGPSLPLMPLVAFSASKQRGRFDRFYRVLAYHVMGQRVDSWKAALNHSNLQILHFSVWSIPKDKLYECWFVNVSGWKCVREMQYIKEPWVSSSGTTSHRLVLQDFSDLRLCIEAIKYWSWRWEESENRNVLCTPSAHNAWRGPNMSIRKTDLADYGPLLVTGVRDIRLKCWNANVIYMTAMEVLKW